MAKKIKSIEEACINYALSALRGAVNLYYHYRGKGYPEDKCISIATNYAMGMIVSSGVLTNEQMRERFIYSLRAINGMINGILNIISNLPPTPSVREKEDEKGKSERKRKLAKSEQ